MVFSSQSNINTGSIDFDILTIHFVIRCCRSSFRNMRKRRFHVPHCYYRVVWNCNTKWHIPFSGAADILSLLISISFTAWNVCCIFVPILKAQFTGVLVTQPKMSNDFDKTKSIHPVEWISHAVSLVVLIVIIICLTSSSWYTVTVDGEADIVMDLSGPEFPSSWILTVLGHETYSDISDEFQSYYNDFCLDGSWSVMN